MKKIATLMLALIVAPLSSLADFNDVPSDSWYHPYVEQLVADGVFDEGEVFRPADPVNRAEFVKIVITAVDGLDDYEAPAEPTFSDVPESAWYYSYVEAAAQLGIVNGYTDAQGDLTGQFGPADTLNRAAATKILVNTFKVTQTPEPASSFPDVVSGAWYYDFVVTAYNQSILDGYGNGSFGPADAVTRAQVAKLVVNSRSPKLRPIQESEEEDDETGQPLESDPDSTVPQTSPTDEAPAVEVTEVPINPEEVFVPADADGEPNLVMAGEEGKFIGAYRFYGTLEGFTVSKLTIVNDLIGNQMGDNVTPTTAIKEVILRYRDETGLQKTTRAPLSNGEITFGGLDFHVPKRDDAVLEVYADINPMSAVGNQLSGTKFRLGMRDVGNTASTFEAVGQITSTTEYLDGSLSVQTLGGTLPSEFVVRKTRPVITLESAETILAPGDRDLIKFKIAAENNGPISVARMVFDVSPSVGVQLEDFQFLRGGTVLSPSNVSIYSGGVDVTTAGAGTVNSTAKVIVSFGEEEIVGAGSSSTYTLRAKVTGSVGSSYVFTKFADTDDAQALTPNTDALIGGIFAGAVAFHQSIGAADSFIWSDRAADNHQFDLTGFGSSDWTNGYLLRLNVLPSHSLNN